jgi:lysozyme
MPTLTAKCDTALTSTPLESRDPNVGYVFRIKSGTALKVDRNSLSQDINKKAKATFKPHLTLRGDRWTELFLFIEHWEGVDEVLRSKVATAMPFSAAGNDRLILPITYRSQVDNSSQTGQGEGWRQCALTSIVMFLEAVKGLAWLLQQSAGYEQPEDWYATQLTAQGFDTTDPQAHAWMLREIFGIPVKFRYDLALQDAKETLDRALGMVCGVRYKADGHYQYLSGKHLTKGGLIWKDPYGDRVITDSTALDSYLAIGSGGDNVYWPIPVVQNTWLDLGHKAGWGLWPEPSVYGFNFQKPVIEFNPENSHNSTAAGTVSKNGNSRFLKPQEFCVTEAAREIINSWEGWRSQQYFCSAGVSTIGWGSTRWFDGGGVPIGATVNAAQARQLQDRDLEKFVSDIAQAVNVPLTENQLAALTSWQYNTGAIGAKQCGLRDAINRSAGNAAIVHEFRRWNKADGVISQGLVNRRESEVALWEGRDWKQYR